MNPSKIRIRCEPSNPASGIKFSVRVPISLKDNKNKEHALSKIDNSSIVQKNYDNSDTDKVAIFVENHQMRDPYNRKQKLDLED